MAKIERKFLFFCGKGGVGKTTCAVSTAVKLSEAGYKTLLFSTDPAHSISDSLEYPLSNCVTAVKTVPNLYAMEIDARFELQAFIKSYRGEIKEFFSHTAYFDDSDINELLLLTLPGLDELMGMKKIADFVMEQNDYRYFICDTAPTGHALRLISAPAMINQWVKTLAGLQWKYQYVAQKLGNRLTEDDDFLIVLKKIVNSTKQIFDGRFKTVFSVVTIPEAMGVAETKRLIQALGDLNITAQNLIINNVIPPNKQCSFCTEARTMQAQYINELDTCFPNMNRITLLKRNSEVKGLNKIMDFSVDLKLRGLES